MDYFLQTASQLSSHLRALRKAKGLSQAELGKRLGLSQARVARIEGDPLAIGVEQLLRVLAALGTQVMLTPVPSGSASVRFEPMTMTGGTRQSGKATPAAAGGSQDW